MIDHAIAALAPFAATTLVCGRQTPGALPDLPRVGLGPLGGLAAALDHAERHGFGAVLTIGCDMPRVPATLLAALIAAAPAYCPDAPILGCWPVSLADELLAWLATFAAGERGPSLRAWAERSKATPVPAPAPLPNINTPADLARL